MSAWQKRCRYILTYELKGYEYYSLLQLVHILHTYNTGSLEDNVNKCNKIFMYLTYVLETWELPNTKSEAAIYSLIKEVTDEFDAICNKQEDDGN